MHAACPCPPPPRCLTLGAPARESTGNLLESFVYKKNDKSSGMTLFIVYLVCAALGTLLSVLLRNVASTETPKAGGQRSHGDEEKVPTTHARGREKRCELTISHTRPVAAISLRFFNCLAG